MPRIVRMLTPEGSSFFRSRYTNTSTALLDEASSQP